MLFAQLRDRLGQLVDLFLTRIEARRHAISRWIGRVPDQDVTLG